MPKVDGTVRERGKVSPELVDFATCNHSSTAIGYFEASLARQEFADECDINVIMASYEKTGVMSHVRNGEPFYMDFGDTPGDLMESMDFMRRAEEAFMMLPAKVRREFDNDARQFVEFAEREDSLDQMREWGLAPPKPQEPPEVAPEGKAPKPPKAPPVAPPEPPKDP